MHEIPEELERRLRAMGISEELLEEGRRTGSIDGVSILPSPLSVALSEEMAALQAEIEQDDRDLLELQMDVDRDGDGFIGSHPRRVADEVAQAHLRADRVDAELADEIDALQRQLQVPGGAEGVTPAEPVEPLTAAEPGPEPHRVGPIASTAEDVIPHRDPPRGPFVQGTSRALPIAIAIAVGALMIVAILVLR